jgi:hypothetical protein
MLAARTGKNSGAENKSEIGLQERSSDWHATWGNGTVKTQAGKITAREKEIRAETLSGKDEDLCADRAQARAISLAAKSERDLTEERDCSWKRGRQLRLLTVGPGSLLTGRKKNSKPVQHGTKTTTSNWDLEEWSLAAPIEKPKWKQKSARDLETETAQDKNLYTTIRVAKTKLIDGTKMATQETFRREKSSRRKMNNPYKIQNRFFS